MRQPLLISSLLTHAERYHGEQEVVSRRVEGDVHRYSYRELAQRSRRLAHVLARQGVGFADRVATLAWNGHRHLELAFAVAASGAVLHTLSPRLAPEQLVWMGAHAKDRLLFFDLSFLPVVEAIAAQLPGVQGFVVMTDRAHMPVRRHGLHLLCYEELIEQAEGEAAWGEFDEDSASALSYVPGTGGTPKGVLYSHRSTLLQAYAAAQPDAFGCSALDAILPAVPMSHGNAWGLPYVACMVGAKLVLPGPWLDGKSLYELVEAEEVTVSAAVPGAWQDVLEHVESHGIGFSRLRRMIVGGSVCAPTLGSAVQARHGVQVRQAWGAVGGNVGTIGAFQPRSVAIGANRRLALPVRQGRPVFGVELKIVGADGRELPHDGITRGDLLVRGPWVAAGYFGDKGDQRSAPAEEDWFPTGEVATINAEGLLQITGPSDRPAAAGRLVLS